MKSPFKYLIVLSLIFTPLIEAAGPSRYQQANTHKLNIDRAHRWMILEHDKNPNTQEETTVIQRFTRISADRMIPVSTLTQTIQKRPVGSKPLSVSDAKEEAIKMVAFLRGAVKGPEWTVIPQKDKRTFVFRADWRHMNRFVSVSYKDLGDRFLISTVSIRRVYAFPVLFEAYLLQENLVGQQRRQVSWFEWLKDKINDGFSNGLGFGIEKAVAQLSPLGSIGITGNSLVGSVNLNTYQGLLNTTNQGLANFGNTIEGSVGRIGTSIEGTAGRIGQTAVGQVNGVINNAAAQTRGVIDYGVAQGKSTIDYAYAKGLALEQQTYNDAKRLLNQQLSTGNVLRVAFLAGIGGAVGAAVANFALDFLADGTAYVVSGIYHSLMGTLNEADKNAMRKAAGEAFDLYEKSAEELNRIEIAIDLRVAALGAVAGVSTENVTESLIMAGELNDKQLERERLRLRRAADGSLEESQCLARVSGMEKLRGDLTAVRQIIANDGGSIQGMCDKIQMELFKWHAAEANLQNARTMLSSAAPAIFSQITANVVKANQQIGSDRRNGNFCDENKSQLQSLGGSTQVSQNCMFALQGTGLSEQDKTARCQAMATQTMTALINRISANCTGLAAMQAQRLRTDEIQHALYLTTANIESTKSFLQGVAGSECAEGVVGGVCNGRAGQYYQIRQRYERLFANAKTKCPQLIKPAVLEDQTLGTLREAGAGGGGVGGGGGAPGDPAPATVSADASSGFSSTWIGRLWNSMFG